MDNPSHTDYRQHLAALLGDALATIAPDTSVAVELEQPRQADHGDYASSAALQLAKPMRRNPRDIAKAIADALPLSPWLERAEVAGAGFVNFFLKPAARQAVVRQILAGGDAYGRCNIGRSRKVQVEYVSANPTGPLHVGHGRGAAYGASLANVLDAAGYRVQREYYVNDAGRQMDILALSTWLRYLEICGVLVPFPANAYRGDYVRDMARELHGKHGLHYVRQAAEVLADVPPQATMEEFEYQEAAAREKNEIHLDALIASAKGLLGADYDNIHGFALGEQLADCRGDLVEFGVTFDCWFSEKSLYDSGMVERAVARLAERGHAYEQDGALWFRSTAFGDEKDRVVRRENGQYTYFASDIAYHLNKLERGYDRVIDIWGADHHGYIPRVKGALQALGSDAGRLEIALVQFAVLYRNGTKVPMSTRSGEFVTLRELRDEVGNDAARFFYVLRKSDQHLDFDLDLAKSQSNENPVYYIQYAHARVCSVLDQWGGDPADLRDAPTAALASEHEVALLRRLMHYPDAVEAAARDLAPHLVAFYLKDLAADFHSYYNAVRFLVPEEDVKLARLALVAAVGQVLRAGLALLGVGAPRSM